MSEFIRGVYALYLKSLEMRGFKSFPDKTVLNFDSGITAIVGPNGSGKSNISDAIRWVLGEQSTKALRGAKMEDVIFGGTEDRGPMAYAEVSLILDNSDHALPIEDTEVMVTRRYYRSSESEFYINKSSVRLRDIHELFMDTGLGRDGYSVIGQGRIDEILSVKSTDRREIFEEAAGISKYRYRKDESERKLDATESNLVRINDKISELEFTVGPLKEQAEQAEKYLKLRDELRVLEVSVWHANLLNVKSKAEEVLNDYKNITSQLENEQAELEALYNHSEELTEEMREKEKEIELCREKQSRLEEELSAIESEIAVLSSTKKNILENINRLKDEIAEQSERASDLETQIEESEARIQRIDGQLADIDTELLKLNDDVTAISGSSADLARKVDALGAKGISEENEINRLRMEMKALESTCTELEQRREELGTDLDSRRELIKSLENQCIEVEKSLRERRQEAESLSNVISGYEIRLQSRQRKLQAATEDHSRLNLRLHAEEDRIKMLSDMERDYEGFSRAVKLIMNESNRGNLRGVHGPLSMLIKTSDDHALAIETALGSGLQNIVVNNDQDAKAAIELLKQRNGGRATFLPISAIRGRRLNTRLDSERGFIGIACDLVKADNQFREIIENALGRTVIVEDLDYAIAIAKKYSYGFRIVTLDGQVVNAGGSMTGGSSSKNTGILVRSNELDRLRRGIGETRALLEKAEAGLKEIKREVTAAEYELDVAKNEHRLAEENVLKTEGELSVLTSRLESNSQIEASISREIENIDKRITGVRQSTEQLASLVLIHESKREEINSEIEKIRREHADLETTRGELSERAAALREQRSGCVGERETLIRNIRELKKLEETYSEDSLKRETFIEGYRERMTSIDDELLQKREQTEILVQKRQELRNKTEELIKSKLELESDRTRTDRKSKEKNEVILRLQREHGRLEQKRNESEIFEQQITDKLWDTYGLTKSTAEPYVTELTSISAANKNISRIKREMSALGDVNIGAIEEYKRISERYNYLISQRNDVEKAKNDLVEIIEDITKQMKDIFRVRFAEINESFSETFAEIFGGGSARLELEDEDDILNCGIEIHVRLPGKSLKTISLLSGGEKAFVAIALYFAILKVSPTSFCVLDEIDAALDDVNVTRFAQYLHRLVDKTQFILITHRRGTMEECDLLYGVTMEKSGQSKILALNINEAERELGIQAI